MSESWIVRAYLRVLTQFLRGPIGRKFLQSICRIALIEGWLRATCSSCERVLTPIAYSTFSESTGLAFEIKVIGCGCKGGIRESLDAAMRLEAEEKEE